MLHIRTRNNNNNYRYTRPTGNGTTTGRQAEDDLRHARGILTGNEKHLLPPPPLNRIVILYTLQ